MIAPPSLFNRLPILAPATLDTPAPPAALPGAAALASPPLIAPLLLSVVMAPKLAAPTPPRGGGEAEGRDLASIDHAADVGQHVDCAGVGHSGAAGRIAGARDWRRRR